MAIERIKLSANSWLAETSDAESSVPAKDCWLASTWKANDDRIDTLMKNDPWQN